MNLRASLIKAYFNYVYNPVYDFTTGRLNCYRKLQERCIGKLALKEKDRILCLGVGTGNEIFHILKMNRGVDITCVDYSLSALRKAQKKALAWGKDVEIFTMDARRLDFATGSFDEVVCIHVTDFIDGNEKVTGEILRVLKEGGQFVITYPQKKEGLSLGLNLLKDVFSWDPDNWICGVRAFLKSISQIVLGFVYLPLFLRSKKEVFLANELKAMFANLQAGVIEIEPFPIYQDYIVFGKKIKSDRVMTSEK
ncbi:class I SAM-dependent methyltransferase [Chloroflexota bacterium]